MEDIRIRTIHVIPRLDVALGGPSYSVPRLCKALGEIGVQTNLFSLETDGISAISASDNDYHDRRFTRDYAHIPILHRLHKSSSMSYALRETASTVDVIHNHGLWLLPNIYAAREAERAGIPFVVSPRGMLSPVALRFSPLKKRLFWQLIQGPAMRHTSCLHATSVQEYEELRGFGLVNPVAIIPNGIDLPEVPGKISATATNDRVVLSLGRIHPKKGLDRLLRAWAKVEASNPGWRLLIAGPSESGHDLELRSLAAVLGLARVSIEGPIYGELKTIAYRESDLFVLPTLNENFGLTVAESLAAGTPVIATKGAPWSGLETEGCGWWIDHGVEPLTTALASAMKMPQETLKAMGVKGRMWMTRDFTWDRVARDMLDLYRWLRNKQDQPDFLRLN